MSLKYEPASEPGAGQPDDDDRDVLAARQAGARQRGAHPRHARRYLLPLYYSQA